MMYQNDHDFLQFVILERMNSHYAARHKTDDAEHQKFCALEEQLNQILEDMPKEQKQVVRQYIEKNFDRDADLEEFYYRCGLIDGYKLCQYIMNEIEGS